MSSDWLDHFQAKVFWSSILERDSQIVVPMWELLNVR
jgi:hypothetical protein